MWINVKSFQINHLKIIYFDECVINFEEDVSLNQCLSLT
jgi:hypothetical protein